jgi:hypothetical protein
MPEQRESFYADYILFWEILGADRLNLQSKTFGNQTIFDTKRLTALRRCLTTGLLFSILF